MDASDRSARRVFSSGDDVDRSGFGGSTAVEEREEDDVPATRSRGTTRRRNRALVALIVVVGLLALVVVGWFAGILVSKVLGTSDEIGGGGPSAAATSSAAPTSAAPSTTGQPIAVQGATLFDPPPGDGEENPARIDLSYDGNQGTVWPTLQYSGSAAFGNIKPGVGIVYDLGSEQPLASVTVTTTLPGSTAEIRVGPADGEDLAQYTVVSPGQTLTGETTFPVAAGTTTRYVLVWLTQLVPVEDGQFQANLAEVSFTG